MLPMHWTGRTPLVTLAGWLRSQRLWCQTKVIWEDWVVPSQRLANDLEGREGWDQQWCWCYCSTALLRTLGSSVSSGSVGEAQVVPQTCSSQDTPLGEGRGQLSQLPCTPVCVLCQRIRALKNALKNVLSWKETRWERISKDRSPETTLPFRRWKLFGELVVWTWRYKQAYCFLMLEPEKGIVVRSDVITLLAYDFCSCPRWKKPGASLQWRCLCLTNRVGLFQKEAQEKAKGSGPSVLQEGGSKPVVTASPALATTFWPLCLFGPQHITTCSNFVIVGFVV